MKNLIIPIVSALLFLCQPAFCSKLVQLDETLYLLYGGGGKGANTGILVGEKSIILIDTMMSESQAMLLESVNKVSEKPVSTILNTHDHFDHTGNNQYFSVKDVTFIHSENTELKSKHSAVFSGSLRTTIDGITIEAYSVNSHSPTDVIYFLPDNNTAFIGDIYTDEWYPSFFSGGMEGQKLAIEKALSLGDAETKYIPGHGKIANKQALKNYLKHCQEWMERILYLHKQGVTPKKMTSDSSLLSIREAFSADSTNRENFNKWFETLIENSLNSHLNSKE